MAIVILDVPQTDEDTYEMPTEQWMKLATSSHQVGLIAPHGCVGTDGIRMHVSEMGGDCLCSNKQIHDKINDTMKVCEGSKFVFRVCRRFLIEALAGINPDDDTLIFFSNGPKSPIVIRDHYGFRAAVIMPIDSTDPEVQETVKLPRVEEMEEDN